VVDYGPILKRVPYDVGHTIGDLRAAPLPEQVIEGLERVLRPASASALSGA
jgi:hypothetical protein